VSPSLCLDQLTCEGESHLGHGLIDNRMEKVPKHVIHLDFPFQREGERSKR
ncbi:unnamed protein product, partial [Dovyalis caffra]